MSAREDTINRRPTVARAVDRFRIELCDRSAAVDPESQLDWYDLAMGFFLGAGCTLAEARTAANYVAYERCFWTRSAPEAPENRDDEPDDPGPEPSHALDPPLDGS